MTTQAQSPELQAKIAIWRQKAIDGTLTVEEMKEAILALRAGRVSAAHASENSKRKAAKVAIPSADDLLAELSI
jgi:hypothetical protein